MKLFDIQVFKMTGSSVMLTVDEKALEEVWNQYADSELDQVEFRIAEKVNPGLEPVPGVPIMIAKQMIDMMIPRLHVPPVVDDKVAEDGA